VNIDCTESYNHSVIRFCYFVCVLPYIMVLAWRSGGETWLQQRDRLMERCQLTCQSLMNNEVWCMMNCEFFTSVVIWCSVRIRLRIHWLFLWRCLAVSISASSSVGRCDVSTKPEAVHLRCYILFDYLYLEFWSTFGLWFQNILSLWRDIVV